jgi:hypothetical protein
MLKPAAIGFLAIAAVGWLFMKANSQTGAKSQNSANNQNTANFDYTATNHSVRNDPRYYNSPTWNALHSERRTYDQHLNNAHLLRETHNHAIYGVTNLQQRLAALQNHTHGGGS